MKALPQAPAPIVVAPDADQSAVAQAQIDQFVDELLEALGYDLPGRQVWVTIEHNGIHCFEKVTEGRLQLVIIRGRPAVSALWWRDDFNYCMVLCARFVDDYNRDQFTMPARTQSPED